MLRRGHRPRKAPGGSRAHPATGDPNAQPTRRQRSAPCGPSRPGGSHRELQELPSRAAWTQTRFRGTLPSRVGSGRRFGPAREQPWRDPAARRLALAGRAERVAAATCCCACRLRRRRCAAGRRSPSASAGRRATAGTRTSHRARPRDRRPHQRAPRGSPPHQQPYRPAHRVGQQRRAEPSALLRSVDRQTSEQDHRDRKPLRHSFAYRRRRVRVVRELCVGAS